MNSKLLSTVVLGSLASPTLVAQTFVDDFNNASSAGLYTITQTADAVATFAFDYSTFGIPPAPNTTDGTTLGLKMEANIATGSPQGVTLHTLVPGTGNFAVKFDAWINANGPFPIGGTGSTEFLTMGVGGDSTSTNVSPTGSGGWFAVSGEGGSSRDWRGFKDGAEQLAESGQFNAGNSSSGGGAHNASSPYYAQFGNVDVTALPQSALFAQQNGITQPGCFGLEWHEVELRVVADGGTGGATSVSWWVDGLQIATLDAGNGTPFVTDGAVTIGYMDIFGSISDNSALSWGLVDNLRIGVLAEANPFGSGCPGANGEPVLTATNFPNLGATLQLEATNLDPIVPVTVLNIGFNSLPVPVSLSVIGLAASCELLITPDVLVTYPAAGGTGTIGIPIPASAANLGFPLFFQGGSLDSVALGGLALTNAIGITIGL